MKINERKMPETLFDFTYITYIRKVLMFLATAPEIPRTTKLKHMAKCTKWKPWKTVAVLQAACRARQLDTCGCVIKKDYCRVLNDWEEAQEVTAAEVTEPPCTANEIPSHESHKRHDSKEIAPTDTTNLTNKESLHTNTPPRPRKPRARTTRQDLRNARAELLSLHQRLPLALAQAQKAHISRLKISPEGTVIPRISELRAGILLFDVETVHEEDIPHYCKATLSQKIWLEFELQQFFNLIIEIQSRNSRDAKLVEQDSSGQLKEMLKLVDQLVAKRNEILERAYRSNNGANVEDYTNWPLSFDMKSEDLRDETTTTRRLRELQREIEWLEGDLAKWEAAIREWEDLMGREISFYSLPFLF